MLYIKKTEKKSIKWDLNPPLPPKKKTCCYLCGVAYRASYWTNKPCYVKTEC